MATLRLAGRMSGHGVLAVAEDAALERAGYGHRLASGFAERLLVLKRTKETHTIVLSFVFTPARWLPAQPCLPPVRGEPGRGCAGTQSRRLPPGRRQAAIAGRIRGRRAATCWSGADPIPTRGAASAAAFHAWNDAERGGRRTPENGGHTNATRGSRFKICSGEQFRALRNPACRPSAPRSSCCNNTHECFRHRQIRASRRGRAGTSSLPTTAS